MKDMMKEIIEGGRRPFATGSKPGPDAIDHFLEEKGFYRKHIARDASSLFRVVSDQVYDVQNYHEKVRQDCAAFMENRPKDYTNEVDKNFFNYISQLRRSRTHGSLLELRVLARMFKKNVILFEPTSNLQTTNLLYVQDDSYDQKNPLRVFYSHKDKHFDVIYTMEHVERLAENQAIVYNILYSGVYKLPDVSYAVERMLHDQEEKVTLPLESNPDQFVTQSGVINSFDSHEDTNCVLKDPKTCHFHNQVNFEEIVDEHKDAITIINRVDDQGRIKIYKPIDGFLHDKNKSCVRQLLDEGITPFPYKVAKALDPSIYRNTEFELWSENRKEQRLKWLDSAEFPMKHHMDDKNFMYNCNRNRRNLAYEKFNNGAYEKFSNDKYEGMILDEDHYMSLDEDDKKKYIVLDHSMESYKLHQLTSLDHFVPSKDSLEMTVMPVNTHWNRGGFKNKRGGGRFNNYHNNNGSNYQSQTPHSLNSNSEGPNQQMMTYASDIERRQPCAQSLPDQQWYQQQAFESHDHQLQQNIATPMFAPAPSHQGWSGQMIPFIQTQQQQIQYAPLNYQHIMPYGNFAIPPPTHGPAYEASVGDVLNIMPDSDLSTTGINLQPKESVSQDGEDLPKNDCATMQFFFNLGVRYFYATGSNRRYEIVTTQMGNLALNDSPTEDTSGNESISDVSKTEAPPVPTNTPVSTKMSVAYGPPGNRFHGENRNSGNRRPFSNRGHERDDNYRSSWNNNRKEIKFNSNVKNLHKNEPKIREAGQQSKGTIQTQTFHASGSNEVKAKSPPNNSGLSPTSNPDLQYRTTYGYNPNQQQMMAPPQGMAMIVQVSEDGSYIQPMTSGVQYAQTYPYQGPSQQVFYPMQQTQFLDGSLVSSNNDSGILEASQCVNYHGYQQPIQYYQQVSAQPVPMYYTPSLPATPQVTHLAPIYPNPAPLQPVISVPQAIPLIAPSISNATDDKETSTDK